MKQAQARAEELAKVDLYAVLGVDPLSTAAQIKSAYRRLAVQWCLPGLELEEAL